MAAAHSFCFSLNVLSVALIGLQFGVVQLLMHASCTAAFSAKLIHRDSPESPLYDPASIHRSASYLHSFNSHNHNSPIHHKELYTVLTGYDSDYLMLLFLHDRVVYAIIRTDYSLVWLLCGKCKYCYPSTQQKVRPSNHKFGCQSEQCSHLPHKCDKRNNCLYEIIGNTNIIGVLSSDMFQLPSRDNNLVNLNNFTYGCTHRTDGYFLKQSLGHIGLGGGPLSFVSQLKLHSYDRMFSYCLPYDIRKSTEIHFGSSAKVSGPRAMSTPMFTTDVYKVTLEAITVVGTEDHIILLRPQGVGNQGGNVMMDCNSFHTYMDRHEVMEALWDGLKKRTPFPTIDLARDSIYQLCFNISDGWNIDLMPKIMFNFTGGASLVLGVHNAFVLSNPHALCFTILEKMPYQPDLILGTHAQKGYRFGYNVDAGMLTILEGQC